MAQGFKGKAPKVTAAAGKQKSSATRSKLQPKDPKKGARVCPPKNKDGIAKAIIARKNTSSHSTGMERMIANQAISKGKLTIMKQAADTEEQREADRLAKRGK